MLGYFNQRYKNSTGGRKIKHSCFLLCVEGMSIWDYLCHLAAVHRHLLLCCFLSLFSFTVMCLCSAVCEGLVYVLEGTWGCQEGERGGWQVEWMKNPLGRAVEGGRPGVQSLNSLTLGHSAATYVFTWCYKGSLVPISCSATRTTLPWLALQCLMVYLHLASNNSLIW